MLELLGRDAAVLALTAVGGAGVTLLAIRAAERFGFVDWPAPHKFHTKPTPYLGGLAVALPVLGVLAVAISIHSGLRPQLLAIMAGGVAVAAIGFVDDLRTLGATPRLVVQAAAAVVLWTGGVRVTLTGVTAVDVGLTLLVVLTVTNAINLLDNMDGLSAGTVAVASIFCMGIASWQGHDYVSFMAAAMAGACLGFLVFNFPPARIFLGDAGTLFLGYLLSVLVIKLTLPAHPTITRIATAGLILAVPLFDLTLVVLSRWRGGRPVFRGGTDHTSHRLASLGLSPREIAMITYATGAVSCSMAMLILWANEAAITWLTIGPGVSVAIVGGLGLERLYREIGARPPGDPAIHVSSNGGTPAHAPPAWAVSRFSTAGVRDAAPLSDQPQGTT
jgi:UDP-GlcNAc:undecaprenyl-phosphate GlcNAc-1-phosphate transferase